LRTFSGVVRIVGIVGILMRFNEDGMKWHQLTFYMQRAQNWGAELGRNHFGPKAAALFQPTTGGPEWPERRAPCSCLCPTSAAEQQNVQTVINSHHLVTRYASFLHFPIKRHLILLQKSTHKSSSSECDRTEYKPRYTRQPSSIQIR
jgi:hypothetical protein